MHKAFFLPRARASGGTVRLSCLRGTPEFEQAPRAAQTEVRILRREEPAFQFGKDYAEFFHGLRPEGAATVFEGALPLCNGRKLEYTDARVEPQRTYAYWVGPLQGEPSGPAPVRVRDPGVWWTQAELQARMAALAAACPRLAVSREFGATVHGRPIRALVLGNPKNLIALVGIIHAAEAGPELILPALERLARNDADLLARAGVLALPAVNQDERERAVLGCPWYLRTNAHGVDLNRNFDADWEEVHYGYGLDTSDPDSMAYRGPAPASEPETRAVARCLEEFQPRAVFSFHALACIAGARFLTAAKAEHDAAYRERCRICAVYARGMYPQGPPCEPLSFGCTPGSLPHWLYRRFGIPGFDLEWDSNPDSAASHADQTTPELLALYQTRHYQGIRAVLQALADVHT